MDEIYQANILDHYRNPRHHGALPSATTTLEGNNPSCGDAQTLFFEMNGEVIANASFVGDGCAISQAATSMLLEKIIGKDKGTVLLFGEKDIQELLGVPIGESREKCMMLGISTLQKALKQYA
jgi:nitrogen fixation protein NifU and related proteins